MAHDDGPAVDDAGQAQPVATRHRPAERAGAQIKTVQRIRFGRREQHAALRQDRADVAPATRIRRLPAQGHAIHDHVAAIDAAEQPAARGPGRVVIATGHRVGVGPEERPGGKVDGDGRACSGGTDEHPFGKRRRQPGKPPQLRLGPVGLLLFVEFRERLRPQQATVGCGPYVEANLPLLLHQHEQLIANHERGAEIPHLAGCLVGRHLRRQPPCGGPPAIEIVGGECVAGLERGQFADTPPHAAIARSAVASADLHAVHESPVARHCSAGGVGEDPVHARGFLRPPLLAVVLEERPGLGIRRIGATQPHPLTRGEIDCQQAERRVHENRAVDCQRHAGGEQRGVAVGTQTAALFEKPRLFGMTRQRHAVPRHEKRTRGIDQCVAGGISPGHPPFGLAASGSRRSGPCDRFEPRGRTARRKCQRHVAGSGADAGASPRAGVVEHTHSGRAIAGPPPRHRPHHRHRGFESGASRPRQSFEPGRGGQRLFALECLERRKHRRPLSGRRVKPAPGDRHHSGPVAGRDRLLQQTIGPCTKLQIVGRTSGRRHRPDQPRGLRLDAAPGGLTLLRTKEEVSIAGEHLVEKGRCITPPLIGHEPLGTIELSLLEAVGWQGYAGFDRFLGGLRRLDGVIPDRSPTREQKPESSGHESEDAAARPDFGDERRRREEEHVVPRPVGGPKSSATAEPPTHNHPRAIPGPKGAKPGCFATFHAICTAERITSPAIMLRPIDPPQQHAGLGGPGPASPRTALGGLVGCDRNFSARNPNFALQFHFQSL